MLTDEIPGPLDIAIPGPLASRPPRV
jgi:hypothetical protein